MFKMFVGTSKMLALARDNKKNDVVSINIVWSKHENTPMEKMNNILELTEKNLKSNFGEKVKINLIQIGENSKKENDTISIELNKQ